MARKTTKKVTAKRRKVATRSKVSERVELPEDGVPPYDVSVKAMGELLVRVEVTNLKTKQVAMTSCGPNDDIDATVEGLKVRLYHS